MSWASWSEFIAMGGYAPYVWGSYAVTFALMAVEVVLLILRTGNILEHLGRRRGAARTAVVPEGGGR